MINPVLKNKLEQEGYTQICEKEGRGICGIYRFVFTTGLVYGMDETGYAGRWCFETMCEATSELEKWNGIGDPGGEWIKHKGKSGEYRNPKYEYKYPD